MPSYIERNTALAQAALDHALYFLELGANDRAAAYYQFASQQLQTVVKSLAQQEATYALEQYPSSGEQRQSWRIELSSEEV